MVSRNIEHFGKQAIAALLVFIGLGSGMAAAQSATLFEQPAISSVIATRSVMLSVAKAGKHLIAVGERGFIIISDDNGATWTQVSSPVSVTLVKVYFVDAKKGWVVGHAGVVLHSQDGGLSWTRQLDGVKEAQLELDAAQQQASVGEPTEQTQERLNQAQQLVDDGPDKPLLDVLFFNAQEGIVVGAYGLAFMTRDGGASWQSIRGQIDNPSGLHLYSLQQVGNDIFIAGEQGLLLRSRNGNGRFEALTSPYEGTAFGLQATADGSLILFGLRGNAFISPDRGESWRKLDSLQPISLTASVRRSDGALLLADESGRVLRYEEGSTKLANESVGQPSYVSGMVEAANGNLVLSTTRGMLSSTWPAVGSESSK
ncbi:YCF48-related protein [Pseudomonas sp. M5]|uniref:WD40/YVTN/BNR-like repeat-containing protein n=1 Tax=Pseudomonas sp. M5 TaxID=1620788 RepID=UPI001957CF88|nr:YCF48-related protein [Pseudomonas sp. M5]MBM7396825.1 photosystem II stability/assembly factor-like uncharacterized protein [Pseudomonas sp. M5]HDS1756078.1 glycosyl hydrolase [Pseudomonas putida]